MLSLSPPSLRELWGRLVGWLGGCFGSDIMARIDAAIRDGVNVLSLSIGGNLGDYDRDVVVVGAFAAIDRGIVVSVSAENDGLSTASLVNVAPWMITVGARTMDRNFPSYMALEKGERYKEVSLYEGKPLLEELVPGVHGRGESNDRAR